MDLRFEKVTFLNQISIIKVWCHESYRHEKNIQINY